MYCIGLDVGGTKTAVSVGKAEKEKIEICGREEVPTARTPQGTLDALDFAVRRFQNEFRPSSIGISCGGPLDSVTGTVVSPPNLPGWHGFELAKYVSDRFGLPARLENDANACAVAEWKFGAGAGTRNMIFLTFGTGIGAGLILDGKLYAGTNGNAGEIGHVRLSSRGPVGFGKEGSFEGFCSGGGIVRLAKETAARNKIRPACLEEEDVTAKSLACAARNGDAFARKVFAKSGAMLGRGLSILVDVLNPERIVLGGVFMRVSPLLIPAMEQGMQKEALAVSRKVCRVVPALLGESVGDFAALSVAAFL